MAGQGVLTTPPGELQAALTTLGFSPRGTVPSEVVRAPCQQHGQGARAAQQE